MMETAYGQMLPPAASDIAEKWDSLFYFLLILSAIFFISIIGTTVFFLIKYRKSQHEHPLPSPESNHKLELVWTVVPTVLVLIIFAWGWLVYDKMINPPSSSYEIKVIGKQWMWQFQYSNGKTTLGELYVPARQPVKLLMTSDDVIHGFFIPDFRIKSDVVPGMYTSIWFEAREPGEHIVYCAEYCGTAHSKMLAKVIALDEEAWNKWRTDLGAPKGRPASMSLAEYGKQLYKEKGCSACHSLDGSKGIAPSLKGIWGEKQEMEDGKTIVVDANYVRESIEFPDAKIVKGFGSSARMPSFKGMLSEDELNALISMIQEEK